MKEKFEKIKETLGVAYVLVCLFVGMYVVAYNTAKAGYMLVDIISDKISGKEVDEEEKEVS